MKEYIVKEYETFPYKGATKEMPELIRCRDCKYYYEKEWVVGKGSYTTCWYQTIANAHPNDFCSRAERKEECGHQ